MFVERQFIIHLGGDQGQEERDPVHQDGDSPGLQGDTLPQMSQRELRDVIPRT